MQIMGVISCWYDQGHNCLVSTVTYILQDYVHKIIIMVLNRSVMVNYISNEYTTWSTKTWLKMLIVPTELLCMQATPH